MSNPIENNLSNQERNSKNSGNLPPYRQRSHRPGSIWSMLYFFLLGLHWVAFGFLGTHYVRKHTFDEIAFAIWAFCILMGLFYLWIGYAVYKRRSYIYNMALACAGIWLIGFPVGTIVSVLLLTNLADSRHTFTK